MPYNQLSQLETMTILLAEDDASTRKSLVSTLGIYFARVLEAQNGNEAINIFDSNKIDIALLDIDMPEINGLDVASYIREVEPDLPVIILTCHNDIKYMQSAVRLRLMDYLIKPISISQLKETMVHCLDGMQQRGHIEAVLNNGAVYSSTKGSVLYQGQNIQLTHNEKKFLDYMLRKRGSLVNSQQICMDIESGKEMSVNALRNLIYRLRSKIGRDTIIAVKETGYILP